ncbi:hypothetical protein DRQ05_00635 [bacterium]|nr:MAG: hypothetical protein DRQ05_00635 [bacterium]
MPESLYKDQFLLINMLLRMAVMAGIVSLFLGFNFVIDFLTTKSRTAAAKAKLTLLFIVVFGIGVAVRRLVSQGAMDLSLEGTMLAGLLGGVWAGGGVGAGVGLVAYAFGEKVAFPFYLAVGLVSGLFYTALEKRGDVWSYSLNPFYVVYNFFERLFKGELDRNSIPFIMAIVFAFVRYRFLYHYSGRHLLYGFIPRGPMLYTLDLGVLVYTLGIALKILSNARTEILLKEEKHQLINAKLVTLRSQINPHFLFNTLNTITALIRTDSEKAREMTRRLSSIFRKSLDDTSDLHSLSDELAFIDDYLSIERVRFGEERLMVDKEIDDVVLNIQVPVMILQPIVENAIKHGISKISRPGRLRITARGKRNGVEVTIENDGPAGEQKELNELTTRGIGLRNVIERLRIYSGGKSEFEIKFRKEGGASVRFYLPAISARGN